MKACLPRLSARPKARGTIRLGGPGRICLPGHAYTLQRAIPSARARSTPLSLPRKRRGCRNLHRLSISLALRLSLRPRLTPVRLSLTGNPWSFGVGVSRPHCRYLCLHLLFQPVQHVSRRTFLHVGMLPYQYFLFHGFGSVLHARLLSTPRRSTSELLRTL